MVFCHPLPSLREIKILSFFKNYMFWSNSRLCEDAGRSNKSGRACSVSNHQQHLDKIRRGVSIIDILFPSLDNTRWCFRYSAKLGRGFTMLSLINSSCLIVSLVLVLCYSFSSDTYNRVRASLFVSYNMFTMFVMIILWFRRYSSPWSAPRSTAFPRRCCPGRSSFTCSIITQKYQTSTPTQPWPEPM